MKKRTAMLSVALGTACLTNSATASDPQKIVRPDISNANYSNINSTKIQSINQKAITNGPVSNSTQTPSWPADNVKVKCLGINSCKGKGSCAGATNSCSGQNGCKGKGWLSVTAKQCKDQKGSIVASNTDNKKK